jgi:hypothetical protein
MVSNAKGIASFVDEIPNVDGSRAGLLPLFGGFEFGLRPRCFVGRLHFGFELLLCVSVWVENPFFLFEIVMVGTDQLFSEIEGFDFLGGELPSENIEVVAE